MLANRLQKRLRHLKKRVRASRNGVPASIGAFRLYDRDIPEIPLVLDFYGDTAQLKDAALCGALYKRPYEKDEADEEIWLSAMKSSAAAALGIELDRIFIKLRQRQRGLSQYEKTGSTRLEKIICENDLSFKVNLSDYLDTGLFLDRRLLRAMIRCQSQGKKVLNLFSYTGSFSVCAAAGGAASTDSVDLSNTYLSWARENFSLNGLSAGLTIKSSHTGANRLIRADVIEFADKAVKEKRRWDIIIVDPPAFSNSKKMTGSFDLSRDLTELLLKCLSLLAPGGKIFLSVNIRRGAPAAETLESELSSNVPSKINIRVTDLTVKITDEDFKGKKIPKAFLIET
ncbi:MAG: class I SAM-dependent methyltransferase [Treponema sp.]|nr:class I SAM-dependent methyltransferase [Treponema sp.]